MEKYIPREKLSKKLRRELSNKERMTWGIVNPITRTTENKKAYNRKKVQRGTADYLSLNLF